MKRVQINETSDYYLPQVLRHLEAEGQPDLMLGILNAFHEEWKNGNRWMLHILTKSHLILNHIEKLKEMREMVQVEVSFATHDESVRRNIEYFSTSIDVRLGVVQRLAEAGLFVRIMAMPFFGGRRDLRKLKKTAFDRGAKAFKNKGLNYFRSWDELNRAQAYDDFLIARIPRVREREDRKDESFIFKSGETMRRKGRSSSKEVSMPRMDEDFRAKSEWAAMSKMRHRFVKTKMKVIDCGYAECNNIDWGYIR
jgi:DNA repair photolyase